MKLARLMSCAAFAAQVFTAQAQQGVDLTDQSHSPDFPSWMLYGSAQAQSFTPGNGFTYSVLNLTQSGIGGQAGAGWAPQALALDFNAAFGFRFYFNLQNDPSQLRGDGLTLVLADATGVGNGGSDLGYGGLSSASVAFAVDTFHFNGEPVSPSVQLLTGGSNTPVAYTETGLGDSIRNASYAFLGELSYAPSGTGDNAGMLTGTISNLLLGSFSVQAQVDFAALGLAGQPVHYGFTAGNGLATDGQTIQWGAPAPVPEPGSWAMILAGLACLGLIARRRRAQ